MTSWIFIAISAFKTLYGHCDWVRRCQAGVKGKKPLWAQNAKYVNNPPFLPVGKVMGVCRSRGRASHASSTRVSLARCEHRMILNSFHEPVSSAGTIAWNTHPSLRQSLHYSRFTIETQRVADISNCQRLAHMVLEAEKACDLLSVKMDTQENSSSKPEREAESHSVRPGLVLSRGGYHCSPEAIFLHPSLLLRPLGGTFSFTDSADSNTIVTCQHPNRHNQHIRLSSYLSTPCPITLTERPTTTIFCQ